MTGTKSLILIALLLATGLAGCTGGEDGGPTPTGATGPVRMGMLMPLTGDAAALGVPARQGAVLAVEQVNNAGGIDGRTLQLVEGDTQFPNTQMAVSEFNRLAGQGVRFIVGPLASDSSDAVKTQANAAQVVIVSPSSTRPALTGPDHGYFFRTIANDSVQGPQAARLIFEDLAAEEVVVMYQQTGYAQGLKDEFVPAFEGLGGTVRGSHIAWTDDEATHDAKAQEAIDEGGDFVWISGQAPEIASLIKSLRNQGFDGTIMTSEAVEAPQIFDVGGSAVDGTLFTKASPDLEAEAYRDFLAAYKARWNADPGPFDAYAYDTVYVGVAAIKAVGNDGPAIRDWLGSNSVSGRVTTATISFNANGDVTTGGYTLWQADFGNRTFVPYDG